MKSLLPLIQLLTLVASCSSSKEKAKSDTAKINLQSTPLIERPYILGHDLNYFSLTLDKGQINEPFKEYSIINSTWIISINDQQAWLPLLGGVYQHLNDDTGIAAFILGLDYTYYVENRTNITPTLQYQRKFFFDKKKSALEVVLDIGKK